MLKELIDVAQIPGERRRRWFTDDHFDLIVWFDEGDSISGFQLCYNKEADERALTWKRETLYTHHRVDDGEANTLRNATPILVADGTCDYLGVADRFMQENKIIDQAVADFVLKKILQYEISDSNH